MLIRNFPSLDNNYDISNEEDLIDTGVLKHRRNVFIFVDKTEFENKLCKKGKIVVLNECVYLGDNRGNLTHLKSLNSTINRKAVYYGTINLECPNNVKTGYVHFDVAYGKEVLTNHDAKVKNTQNSTCNFGNTYLSTALANANEGCALDVVSDFDSMLIPPEFYTEMQMYKTIGDYGQFLVDYSNNVYEFNRLIDRSTRCSILDVNLWDTMRLEIDCTLEHVMSNGDNPFAVSEMLSSSFANSITSGSIFIFDSDAKGIGKSGVNCIGGKVSYGKYYDKKYAADNLGHTLSLFEQCCHELEHEFGSIRVLTSPEEVGNVLKIRFKDYYKPPIASLGFDNDASFDGKKSSIDKGTTTQLMINETLGLMSKDEYGVYDSYSFGDGVQVGNGDGNYPSDWINNIPF